MKQLSKTMALAATAIAVGTSTLVGASPAQAAARDGKCDKGEFCLYYNSSQGGSLSDFTASVGDYGTKQPGCYEFKGRGEAKGECVKNKAASVWNRTGKTVRVYFNSHFAGASQDFKAGAKGNLNATLKNNNASHEVGPSARRTNLSRGLYKLDGGRITCYFDGYKNTPGRHEGIDIARGVGSPVRALVAGKVINVVRGSNGGRLSTIAVHNAKLKKTVIYLHSAPLAKLKKGQDVKKGQQIATEAWRGISSRSAAHTHIEMRPGRHTTAAKSVGDPHLQNPNPNAFWRSQGYDVR